MPTPAVSGSIGEPWWPDLETVKEIHRFILAIDGLLAPVCNDALLAGALDRAQWRQHFGQQAESMFQIAARIAASIALAHAFNDGNKRTAFYTTGLVLWMNGWSVRQTDIVGAWIVKTIVIAGHLKNEAILDFLIVSLAEYLEEHAVRLD